MTEQAQNTETQAIGTTQPVPASVATPEQVAAIQSAQSNLPTTGNTVPAPEPVQIDRLGHNETFTFTDKNGFNWDYEFQFPGVRKAYEIIDNARMANGVLANSLLYDGYCENVIVKPAGLTLDDFDNRPGLDEVMEAVDTFCGKRLS